MRPSIHEIAKAYLKAYGSEARPEDVEEELSSSDDDEEEDSGLTYPGDGLGYPVWRFFGGTGLGCGL